MLFGLIVMIKLFTKVEAEPCDVRVSRKDRIMILGSCFADEVGKMLQCGGFDVCINPFGTLYNPASVDGALALLSGSSEFTQEDCVQMGAGSGRICSFRHHTSFARETSAEFLENANSSLKAAREFWRTCNKVIITLGSAYVWEHHERGIVANCLKRNPAEFTQKRLTAEQCTAYIQSIVSTCTQGSQDATGTAERKIIFTVSPIRHMAQGAHGNTLSKATLHLSLEEVIGRYPGTCAYFPSYEILCDELRDYRFYAEDLVHPSKTALGIIWERVMETLIPADEHESVNQAVKQSRREAHRALF